MSDIIKAEPMGGGIDAQALIEKAIEKNLDIDKMERILTMRRELKQEFAREEYFRALSCFQKDCPVIEKRKKVFDKSGKERYKFAPLDDIVSQISATLEKHGFSYTIKTEQTKETVTAICFAHHRAGHAEQTQFTVPIDQDAYMSPAQKTASALTYAKRYAFCDAFGIMTGDEDTDDAPGEKAPPPAGKKPSDEPLNDTIKAAGAKVNAWIKRGKELEPDQINKYKQVFVDFMAFVTAKDTAGAVKYAESLPVHAEPVDAETISEIFDGEVVDAPQAGEPEPKNLEIY